MCCLERSILHNASNSVGPPFFFLRKRHRPTSLDTRFQRDLKWDEKRPTATKTRAHRPLFEVVLPKNKAAKLARRISRRAKPTSSGRALGRERTKKRDSRRYKNPRGDSGPIPLNPTCAQPTTPKKTRAIAMREKTNNVSKTHSGRCPHRRTRRRARVVATTRSSRPVSFAGHARKTYWCVCVCVCCWMCVILREE